MAASPANLIGDGVNYTVRDSSSGPYLTLTVDSEETQATQGVAQQALSMGTRHEMCNDPKVADKYPMGFCAYRYEGMKRCGCSVMNPSEHPEVWETYVKQAKQYVRERIESNEITLTFFASGYLLSDCHLLEKISTLLSDRDWTGTLNVQFIDLKYGIDWIKKTLDTASSKLPEGQNIILYSVIAGGGLAALGHYQEKKTLRNIGIIILIAGVILGAWQLQRDDESIVPNIFEDLYSQEAINSFLQHVRGNPSIKSKFSFFPNVTACKQAGTPCDVLLGYDIDNTGDFFNDLCKNHLKLEGKAYAMIKLGEGEDAAPGYVHGTSEGLESPVYLKHDGEPIAETS